MVVLVPEGKGSAAVKATVTANGDQVVLDKTLALGADTETVLLRSDKAIYRSGDTATIEVLVADAHDKVWLDVVHGGRTAMLETVPVVDGKATWRFDVDQDLGGEVLSHRDLFVFLDRARDLNFAVQVLTNGTMLRPGVAAQLASYRNLQGVSISLYGATPEVHDGITQVPGSWRRTWDGAQRLRQLGVTVRLKFILMRQNQHEAAAMRAQAEGRGFPYMVDLTITSRHDRTQGSLETRVDREQLEALYRGPLSDLAIRGKTQTTEETWPCNCARGNVGITAMGDVHPCVSVPWVAGNVREQPFAEIWKTSPVFQRIRGLKLADYEHCAPCDHKDYCQRNRGAAVTYSGSYTGVDPFICETAKVAHKLADERAAQPEPVRARLAVVR